MPDKDGARQMTIVSHRRYSCQYHPMCLAIGEIVGRTHAPTHKGSDTTPQSPINNKKKKKKKKIRPPFSFPKFWNLNWGGDIYLDTYAPRRTGARCLPRHWGALGEIREGLGVIRAYRHADLLQVGILEFTRGGRLASLTSVSYQIGSLGCLMSCFS